MRKPLRQFVWSLFWFVVCVACVVLNPGIAARIGWSIATVMWGLTAGGRLALYIEDRGRR